MTENNQVSRQILINQLKSAYRKYKTHIYFDNHSAIQRCQLAKFERENFSNLSNDKSSFFDKNKINEFFNDLADKVIKNKLSNFSKNIGIIAFPKKMKSIESEEVKVISNFEENSTDIDQMHYFIDLPVEAHILGVLWILRCGYILDDRLYKTCYGNRLNKHLLNSIKEKGSHDYWNSPNNITPFLFEPYYKNYESWRDNALDCVKNLMENNKHAIMISLDFKNYYYSSSIDFDLMWQDICDGERKIHKNQLTNNKLDDENIKINEDLNDFVRDIFLKYHEKFELKFNNTDFPFIPLGFLPSLIIANWNLQGFDQAILEDVHPSYYGRYVDDILIVLDSHEKSETYGNQHLKGLKSIDIIKKYISIKNEYPLNKIFDVNDIINFKIKNGGLRISEDYVIGVHNIKHRIFNKNFIYENLEIQQNKVKLYAFSHKFSTAIIDNFKNEIAKNSSEFKLMKDSEKLFNDFEEKLFDIDYEDSINKINSIKNVRINKFEISKLMSGVLNSSAFSSGKIKDDLIDKVIEAFDSNLFEFFTLWEKLFTLLYITDNEDKLKLFVENILIKIDELNFENKNLNYYYDCENCAIVKDSLKNYLFSTLVRVLSLKSSELYKEFVMFKTKDGEIYKYLNHSFNFIFSSMVNNSFMKYPIQNTFKIENSIKTNWYDGNDIKYDLIKENTNSPIDTHFKGYVYPRYIKLHEILLNNLYNKIHFKSEHNLDELSKLHARLNFYDYSFDNDKIESSIKEYVHSNCNLKCHGSEECPINNEYKSLKVGNNKKTELTVGLINTKLKINDFEKRLIGKPNLKSKRFNKIKRLINEAIKKDVDLLLMPEMYIPFEWINDIVNVSKVHQMAIIFGIEPIVLDNVSYNYIISSLPFSVDNNYFEAIISCRLKNHYAPSEKQSIATHHLLEPNIDEEYYLYSWNGIHIAPFYCYEIADIQSRGKFKSCCDIITVSEFNKDEIYFGNIAESLSRDNYCYCIKANTSEFGGNSIIQPAKSEMRKIVDLKGGDNDYLVVQKLNIHKLRNNAIKSDLTPNNRDVNLKPNPPGLNKEIIKERMGLKNKYSSKNEYNSISPNIIEKKLFKMISDKFPDGLSGKTIGIWGLSLKPNTNIVKSSPAINIVNSFYDELEKIKVHDPKNNKKFSEELHNIDIEYCNSKYDAIENVDALIILTGWDEFRDYDLSEMKKRMRQKIIFDMSNVISDNIKNENFEICKINIEKI